jgi:predicted nucleic acid-binding protein
MMNGGVYVLDACALIAAFNGEPGADMVREKLAACAAHEITLHMGAIQVLEVYYDRIYVKGQKYADEFLDHFFESNIIVDRRISDPVISKAGHYKTTYDMSLADAICLATAASKSVTLITSDHHEFDPVEEAEHFPFLWIRPKQEPKPGKKKADLQAVTAERDQAVQALAAANRRIAELEAE